MNEINREQTIKHLQDKLVEAQMYSIGFLAEVYDDIARHHIVQWVNEIPSARQHGKWVKQELAPQTLRFCSLCGCKKPQGHWEIIVGGAELRWRENNMGRLIDADEYEKRIKPYDTEDIMDKALYNFAHTKLISTPTARPKGKWIKYKDRACWYCSECREDNYYAYSWDSDTGENRFQDHYCPNCGAEMEMKDEEL